MNDSVLILGASGFIGRHLAEAIASTGRPVIAATRRPHEFAHVSIANAVDDFSHPEHFARLLPRVSFVVHAASTSTPASTTGTPLAELVSNLAGATTLDWHPTVSLDEGLRRTWQWFTRQA